MRLHPSLALIPVMLAFAGRTHAQGSAPTNPCSSIPPRWLSVEVAGALDAEPRDGLLLTAPLLASSFGSMPEPQTVSIEVTDSAGATIPGTFELSVSWTAQVLTVDAEIAWRPDDALDPGASYAVTVTLSNALQAVCEAVPDVHERFDITTVTDLTEPPPDPPFVGLVYVDAWVETGPAPVCCPPRRATIRSAA